MNRRLLTSFLLFLFPWKSFAQPGKLPVAGPAFYFNKFQEFIDDNTGSSLYYLRPVYMILTRVLIIACFLLTSCTQGNRKEKEKVVQEVVLPTDSVKKTRQGKDATNDEFLSEKLTPIRENYNRIIAIREWKAVITKELFESTEGGEAGFYYTPAGLQKIVVRHYGEMFQQITEYYLQEGRLSFVFEKRYKYNRPIYYDSFAMKESGDSESFDFGKAEIIEDRSYFENGKLIHQVSNQDCGAPFATSYLAAEKLRIETDFNKLMRMQ